MSFPQPLEGEHKVRGKPEKFAEHYNQATLFWQSQSEIERRHIIAAFRFELTRVQVTGIRERVVAQLRNVAEELAQGVADGLGITALPEPLPRILKRAPRPELDRSQALSLLARPGQTGIRTRRIALLVADGVDGDAAARIHDVLAGEGATPRFIGVKMGGVRSSDGEPVEVEVSLEAAPAVLWDAAVFLGGDGLTESGQALEFLKDQYRHCKAVLVLGSATALLEKAGIPATLPSGEADPGLLVSRNDDLESRLAAFVAAVSRHRHFERETDPPRV
jgi:catalase